MLWARSFVYGVPLILAGWTAWSAHQAAANRATRGGEIVLASGEGIAPTLNPFLPVCEVDRQMAVLLHEPLLRLDASGAIAPALVERWSWGQASSVWFAGETFARTAAANLGRLDPATRAALGLMEAVAEGTELRLRFARPGAQAPGKLLPAIADCGPLPVEFVRVELAEGARGYHEFFLKNSIERAQVKRVWFDGPNAYELGISGETVKFIEELNLFYQNRPALRPQVRSLGIAPMLHRPVLDLVLRADAVFSDGSPLGADDVGATMSFVLDRPWPVAGRDALRLITDMERIDRRTLRVVFKEIHGPALTAFLGLPVLPAAWLERHGEAFRRGTGQPFLEDPPPGAGVARLEAATPRAILVNAGRRAMFLLDQPPAAIRLGFAMRAIDAFWPRRQELGALSGRPEVEVRAEAPRSRLMVLWNCRKPPLDQPRMRAALGLAVDREALAREFMGGQGPPHDGVFRPGLWFAQTLPPPPMDLEKSREILGDLGWSREGGVLLRSGRPLRLELLTVAGNTERAGVAERLRRDWEALGVVVTVTAVPAGELVNLRLPEHRFDAALLGLDFETSWDQTPFWHSSQVHGGLNFSGLADPTLDGLLEALRVEYDLQRIPGLAHEVENRIVAAHPFLTLLSGGSAMVARRGALPAAAPWASLGLR